MSVNMQTRNRNYVYTFVSIAIAAFVMMTIYILLNNNSLEKKIKLTTKISNALGIETHPSVIFKGFEIGKVTGFDFDDDLDVNVHFFVYEKYAKLISDKSIIHPVRNPLTGIIIDLYVFSSFRNGENLKEGDHLASSESGRGRVIAQNYEIKIKEPGVNEVVRRFDVLLKEIEEQKIVTNLGYVSQKLKDSVHVIEGELSKFNLEGGGEKLKLNISDTTDRFNRLFINVNDLVGEFKGRNRSISSTVDKAENVIENANFLLEGINQNEFINGQLKPQKYNGEEGIELNE